MIIDVPTGDDFKASGTDFLNLAWGTLTGLLRNLRETQDFYEMYYGECYEEQNEEAKTLLPTDKYWEKAQRSLSTSLSLIQQGTEFLLKGYIATVSPYLLISGEPSNYPKKSHERDIRFSEFKTIDAQDLIRSYNTVSPSRLPESFCSQFENLRSKRNIIMHTVDTNFHISIKDLIVEILEICHHLIGAELWIATRKLFIENEPRSVFTELEKYREYDYVIYQLASEVDLVIELLQPSEVRKFFGFEKKQRRYICPNCYWKAFRTACDEIPSLASLKPNELNSTSVYCIVCRELSAVIREDCPNEYCFGNVFDEDHDVCLSCGLH